MSTLGFVPARGGSKRIPRKNLLPLGGKPLVAHTIEAAMSSGVCTEVWISTDDADLAEVARQLGAKVDWRPEALCGDRVRFVEVLAEFLQRTDGNWEHLVALQPSSPFRTAADVREFHALMLQHPDAAVVSISAYGKPPQFALRKSPEGWLTMREPAAYALSTQTQLQERLYHPNGALYGARCDRFLAAGSFYFSPLIGYEMPAARALDVDEPLDYAIAQALWDVSAPTC